MWPSLHPCAAANPPAPSVSSAPPAPARAQQVLAYVVLHNSHLEEIAARKPQIIHELGSIKGTGLRRAARYGEELLALIGGEAVTAGQVAPSPSDYRSHLDSAGRLLRSGRGVRSRARACPCPGARRRGGAGSRERAT